MDKITLTAHLPGFDIAVSRRPHPSGNGEELFTIGLRPSFQLGPLGEEIIRDFGVAVQQRLEQMMAGSMMGIQSPLELMDAWNAMAMQQINRQFELFWAPWLGWGYLGR
jgi:hypothetical protein